VDQKSGSRQGHVRPAGVPKGGRGSSRRVACRAPSRWGKGQALAATTTLESSQRGDHVGANPADRGKPGSKLHLVCDGSGLPLTVVVTAANVNDTTMFQAVLKDIPPVRTPAGRRRTRPARVHADKGYDSWANRAWLRRRGIKARIARRGIERSTRLGRHRWRVESKRSEGVTRRLTTTRSRLPSRLQRHDAVIAGCGCRGFVPSYLPSSCGVAAPPVSNLVSIGSSGPSGGRLRPRVLTGLPSVPPTVAICA
jgi:hypothetical protein